MIFRWLQSCRRMWHELREPPDVSRKWLESLMMTEGRCGYESVAVNGQFQTREELENRGRRVRS